MAAVLDILHPFTSGLVQGRFFLPCTEYLQFSGDTVLCWPAAFPCPLWRKIINGGVTPGITDKNLCNEVMKKVHRSGW